MLDDSSSSPWYDADDDAPSADELPSALLESVWADEDDDE